MTTVTLGLRCTSDHCSGKIVALLDACGALHDEIEPRLVRAIVVERPEGDFAVIETPEGLEPGRPH